MSHRKRQQMRRLLALQTDEQACPSCGRQAASQKKQGRRYLALVGAGYVGHHSLEMLSFHFFEKVGHYFGWVMAILAFGGLAIFTLFNPGE